MDSSGEKDKREEMHRGILEETAKRSDTNLFIECDSHVSIGNDFANNISVP
jgi:hypothetical protein